VLGKALIIWEGINATQVGKQCMQFVRGMLSNMCAADGAGYGTGHVGRHQRHIGGWLPPVVG
jgi:hypothetical protein